MPATPSCRLCGAQAPLRDSHILPDFFIRSLERQLPRGSSGGTQPHSTLLSTRDEIVSGERQRGQWERVVGMKEKLLCDACEGKFSVYENYARLKLYGTGPGPRLTKAIAGLEVEPSPAGGPADNGFLGAHLIQFDYRLFKLFVLSLLWRASVARGSFFRQVSLGPYEIALGQCLLADDPGPETFFPILLVNLRHNGDGLEDMIEEPGRGRDQGKTVYSWSFGGFLYLVFVTRRVPTDFVPPFMLKQSGNMIVVTASAEPILRWWASRLGGRLPR